MKALCFTLSGQTAFFKKPEVSTYVYFTYGNIHKVALLGIFGAILGYEGHTQKFNREGRPKVIDESFPEFYERLQRLKVSVIPGAEKGFFRKKVQVFNNSVGYASKETGGNLIVKEQWLELPSWRVYVLLDQEEADKLCEAVQAHRCVYIPYLGKNDHPADLSDVCVKEVREVRSGTGKLSSLFPKENAVLQKSENFWSDDDLTFRYEEKLPFQLDPWTNNYILQSFLYTDGIVSWDNQTVYEIDGTNILFY